ncbi:MAG: LTA synthase family protein, partial [Gemmatimonadota bacterium]|nr:LTA synthase family protein [Gemmatimonadota bacterium]
RAAIRRVTSIATPARLRMQVLAAYAVVLAGLTLFVSPPLGRVSSDRALNEIALNGYYTFWLALLGQDAPYEGLYATHPASEVFPRLHRLLTERATDATSFVDGSTQRRIDNAPPERRWNVVMVLEESLGSEFIGALYPRDRSLTPSFDSLITEGTLLDNAFSTGNRTIRALEATTASIPPLPGIAIVRREQSKDLFTLPALLRSLGYATMFVYGGRALFDGMGSYMRNNGMERVIEQSDYRNPSFTTAWGVADEAIFDKAMTQFDSLHAARKPFYALVLSVSNHRPYTYPAGRIASDPNQKRRENAVEYADYSLGRFMRQARSHGWFDSTLFVLMGDHGARVYGAQEIPLASYEVPILLYAPKLIPAGTRVHTIASSMDMPPTILALLGARYTSRWFGRDVLHLAPDEGRALMTHNNEIALMQRDTLAVLGLRGSSTLLRYDRAAKQQIPLTDAPRTLIDDAIAYFDGADKMYRGGKLRN